MSIAVMAEPAEKTVRAKEAAEILEQRAERGPRVVISAELARWLAALVRPAAGLEQRPSPAPIW